MSRPARFHPPVPCGVTLMEAMIVVVILGIVSLGFGVALQSSIAICRVADQQLTIHTHLVAKMEDLESLDFATLCANSGLSDTVTVNGRTMSRTVSVAAIDADGINGVEADFVEVSVTLGDQSLKTRVIQP